MKINLLSIFSFGLLFLSGCYLYRPISEAEKLKADIYPILNSDQKEEIDELESVHNIEDFIDEFWKYKDPIPETDKNEIKDEYYRRLEYVNIHYKYKKGWGHSDRARVYLIHGHPDDIKYLNWNPTCYLTGPNIQAIEVWTYDKLAPFDNFPITISYLDSYLMTFIFADNTGSGRYFQIYSNVPGEISNPNFFQSFQDSKEHY